MKKSLLSIAIASFPLFVFSQQPLNSSFETWTGATSYSAASPNNWGTFNFDSFGFPRTTFDASTAPFHAANNAVMDVKSGHAPIGIDDIIGGALFYNFDIFTSFGTPYTNQLESIAFYYKANLVNSDTSFIYAGLQNSGNSLAEAFDIITQNTNSWTMLNFPFTYTDSITTPDTLALILQVSAGSWPFYIINYPPQIGSVLEIDNVIFCQKISAGFSSSTNELTADFTSATVATGNSGIGNLSWNFGDGNNSTSPNPSHTYAATGGYLVTLSVTDSCGNVRSFSDSVSVVSTISVNDFSSSSTFSIYPNPSTDIAYLNLSLLKEEDIMIEMFDISGRKVADIFNGRTSNINYVINTSNFEDGIYTVRITGKNGGMLQKKMIITK